MLLVHVNVEVVVILFCCSCKMIVVILLFFVLVIIISVVVLVLFVLVLVVTVIVITITTTTVFFSPWKQICLLFPIRALSRSSGLVCLKQCISLLGHHQQQQNQRGCRLFGSCYRKHYSILFLRQLTNVIY